MVFPEPCDNLPTFNQLCFSAVCIYLLQPSLVLMDANEYPDFTREDAQSIPLKYIGYRAFSKWVATDQNFLVIRRFGALGARVALSLQDSVTELEEKLDELDKQSSRKEEQPINNGTFRGDVVVERRDLVETQLPNALISYCKCILRLREKTLIRLVGRFLHQSLFTICGPSGA